MNSILSLKKYKKIYIFLAVVGCAGKD